MPKLVTWQLQITTADGVDLETLKTELEKAILGNAAVQGARLDFRGYRSVPK